MAAGGFENNGAPKSLEDLLAEDEYALPSRIPSPFLTSPVGPLNWNPQTIKRNPPEAPPNPMLKT
jgi:hypothetical protein